LQHDGAEEGAKAGAGVGAGAKAGAGAVSYSKYDDTSSSFMVSEACETSKC